MTTKLYGPPGFEGTGYAIAYIAVLAARAVWRAATYKENP